MSQSLNPQICIYVGRQLRQILLEKSKKEHMSVSSLIVRAIYKYLEDDKNVSVNNSGVE